MLKISLKAETRHLEHLFLSLGTGNLKEFSLWSKKSYTFPKIEVMQRKWLTWKPFISTKHSYADGLQQGTAKSRRNKWTEVTRGFFGCTSCARYKIWPAFKTTMQTTYNFALFERCVTQYNFVQCEMMFPLQRKLHLKISTDFKLYVFYLMMYLAE